MFYIITVANPTTTIITSAQDEVTEKLDALIPLIDKEDVVNLEGITDQKLKKMICNLLDYKSGDNPTKDQILADIERIKVQIT